VSCLTSRARAHTSGDPLAARRSAGENVPADGLLFRVPSGAENGEPVSLERRHGFQMHRVLLEDQRRRDVVRQPSVRLCCPNGEPCP
jgi:hypothetical protein